MYSDGMTNKQRRQLKAWERATTALSNAKRGHTHPQFRGTKEEWVERCEKQLERTLANKDNWSNFMPRKNS